MWVEVGTRAELEKARRTAVEVEGRQLVVVWQDGTPYAFDNVCIHKGRELVGGVVLNGRLVCPGHQWAFELGSGWCRERERCQPAYPVRVDGDVVLVASEPMPAHVPTGT